MLTIRSYDAVRRLGMPGGGVLRFDEAGYADVRDDLARELVATHAFLRIEARPGQSNPEPVVTVTTLTDAPAPAAPANEPVLEDGGDAFDPAL